MATNDPNKPDNVTYIDPSNKTPEEKDAPDLPQEAGGEVIRLFVGPLCTYCSGNNKASSSASLISGE